MDSGSGATETATFTQALASLKRRGSNLLLVGAANDETQLDACSRLLGDVGSSRKRLFVFTDRGHTVADRLAGVATDSTIIEYESKTRSAAAASSAQRPSPAARRTVTALDELEAAVESAIDEIDDERDLTPAELRVCLDSLRPLLEDYPQEEVFQFLHGVTNDVRSVRGMGHFHLPLAYENETVRTVAPLFDAVVEVRSQAGQSQQRWHLRDEGVSTDWLPL